MTTLKKFCALAMCCCLLFSAGACGETSGGNQGENPGGTTPGGETPGGTTPGGETPGGTTPGENPGGETPGENPDAYVYGEDWMDVYDASYTESLLAMGEQAFTYSQLSGKDTYMRERVTTSGNKEGKFVGIFYFMWQNEGNYPYDISKLLEEYGATDLENNPLWALAGSEKYDPKISPMNAFHYFEEPLYGYYASTDKWVIMRHLELLTYAGVDFLYLDFTNASSGNPDKQPSNIYPEATYALLDSILELQAKGIKCPTIVPMTCNPYTKDDQTRGNVVEWVYHNYYAKDNFKYSSCWFRADEEHNPSGKPLLITYTIDRELFKDKDAYDAFWFRKVVWPTQVRPDSYQNGFPWMDYELPQANYDGIMNVSVAQHIDGHWSSSAFLANYLDQTRYTYRGRGAAADQRLAVETDSVENAYFGLNFAEQWRNAIEATGAREPWMVSVTGWNEWVAQKFDQGTGHAEFVDTFSVAFSRDIEMMRDRPGYGDNFYMQLAANIAKFKAKSSTRKSDTAMWKRQTLEIGDLTAWEKVQAKYIDFSGDAMVRDKNSVGGVYHYFDDSARNDIQYVKLCNDSEYLYVLVNTRESVTPYEQGDENWMNLYLATGAKGWAGYNFVVGRFPEGGQMSIEALSEDLEGNIVSTRLDDRADFVVNGNFIAYRIPLKALKVTSKSEIGVKACDNIFGVKRTEATEDDPGNDGVGVYQFGDIEAFYCGGDCAPAGRLNYAYRLAY